MKIKTLTVTELNNYIKKTLDNDFILNNLLVKGEISNLKYHTSGHIYFSLKDSSSKINCVMFKSNTLELDFKIEEGMEVIVGGRCSIYQGTGSLQLYVNIIQKEGLGKLHIKFEKLKDKLLKEGYFDESNKIEIPKFPKRIGVVTSETGAVIRDIINVTRRRNSLVDIVLYPAKVQGEGAYKTIIEGINYFNLNKNVDVIIIGRGGGSIEELWSFNEEIVAREVFKSKIPIISAVGHETDFTICDFVADMRAPTPSAAAEIATPSLNDLEFKLNNIKNRMSKSLINQVKLDEHRLNSVFERINNYLKSYIIKDNIIQLDKIYDKIAFEVENNIKLEKERLTNMGAMIHSLSPLATIDRGYSIVQKEGQVINSTKEIQFKDNLEIVLKDGFIECTVEKIINKEV